MTRLVLPAIGIAAALSAVAILIPPASGTTGTSGTTGAPAPSQLVIGKRLYRQYCGQCHALTAALSAGFGNNGAGLGENGGPSFDDLRVPFSYSVDAVTEPSGGHELVALRINPAQLKAVAMFIARVTSRNPIPALPTDG
jgi:mono/diheme cytochrome c family protein